MRSLVIATLSLSILGSGGCGADPADLPSFEDEGMSLAAVTEPGSLWCLPNEFGSLLPCAVAHGNGDCKAG